MKILRIQTRNTEASFTNRKQEIESRISGTEDMIKEVNTSIKQNVKSQKF